MQLLSIVAGALAVSYTVAAIPQSQPFREALHKRQSTTSNALQVDLGYATYEGVSNGSTGINTWNGIRFAAPPTGELRWQRPQAPATNRTATLQAYEYGSQCKQIGRSEPGFLESSASSAGIGSEDCLFLNVQSPTNASDLPVLVWIHGGGYGAGNGRQDFTDLLTTNGNNFVVVSLQYRLGPFGFLASDEIVRKGVANAGLLDQYFGLQWVQTYISQFGGDPSAVTISGESAGGGSVMLQDMAYGGSLGDSLFRSTISASPYLPKQYAYNDWVPSQNYYAFAAQAGCSINAYGNASFTIFDCLLSKDTETLQNASREVTATATYGTWAFLPVTDNVFVQDEPSAQLLEKRVNGQKALIGNNANEGPSFVPQDITSQDAFVTWLRDTLPEFSDSDISKVLFYYPVSNVADPSINDQFATNGVSGPSALDQSSLGTGQQQRANNLYAELTFVCPSYWQAEAYTGEGRSSYKYQFSVLPALHGLDVRAYFGPLGGYPYLSVEFQRAFMKIWGNFVTKGDPSISPSFAAGSSSNDTAATNAATEWPAFTIAEPYQLDLNQTGGELAYGADSIGSPVNTTYFTQPGLMNDFTSANAYTWEQGRGARCDFWRSVAKIIPA
ncbi:carboxylesterase type b [Stemphylium lycopersici]|uniref:Carboxylic ester hydrolase n=1 Tax=Stemphylium lycopersici TaxID=183478 RepID=A0A364N8U9_STELY|nr:carboxylesterase type b [Stemphylium lycopersici]RAR13768.1 acetylcholinesterase precursor [Stemphylium lycopersici]